MVSCAAACVHSYTPLRSFSPTVEWAGADRKWLSSAVTRLILTAVVLASDLRPQLNVAYGMTETITPNLDKFAEGALVFHRAYCQQAVCSPSRNSFMRYGTHLAQTWVSTVFAWPNFSMIVLCLEMH